MDIPATACINWLMLLFSNCDAAATIAAAALTAAGATADAELIPVGGYS